MADQKILNKIMGLLAKSEGTDNEFESAAFLAKAQELMIQYAVDQAELTPEERERVTSITLNITKNRDNHILLNAIAKTFKVEMIRLSNIDSETGALVGFETDIAFVTALYASLVLQRETFLARETVPYYDNAKSFNHAFRLAYAGRVLKRFRDNEEAVKASNGPGTALVLVNKAVEVSKRYRELYPNTTNRKSSSRYTSGSGFQAGYAAGSRADLSGGRNNLRNKTRVLV